MKDPLKRWQCNAHYRAVHERERRTQDCNQQDGLAVRFRTRMIVGVEVSRFGTWDRLWGSNRVVHGLFLERSWALRRAWAYLVPDHDHNVALKYSYSYLQALFRFSQASWFGLLNPFAEISSGTNELELSFSIGHTSIGRTD